MRTLALLGMVAGALLAGGAAAPARQDGVERALHKYQPIRERLETAINEQRERAGLGPVVADPALMRAAQAEALAIAERLEPGGGIGQAVSDDAVDRRLAAAGYEAHAFSASAAVSDGEPREVAAWLMTTGRIQLRRPDLTDIGIGIAPSWRSRIYLVVLARSAADHFAAETAALANADDVRGRLLARTNDARAEAGSDRLEPDACLARVAQAYAERMLAEGFFSHTAPGGEEVADRLRAAGCTHRPVGENLAKGPTDPAAVIEEWLRSDSHRRVLLEPRFDRMGLGLAMGRGPDGYGVVWVQVLGARHDPPDAN